MPIGTETSLYFYRQTLENGLSSKNQNVKFFDEFMDIFLKFPFSTRYYTNIEKRKSKYRFCLFAAFLPPKKNGENRSATDKNLQISVDF